MSELKNLSVNDVVALIDAIDVSDPERAHGQLDDLMLSIMPHAIQSAVERLAERAPWWAAA